MPASNTLLVNALIPVFFGLGLGYYAGWRGRIDNRSVASLNTTLMHFVLPCSLFLGVARTPPAVLTSQFPLLAVLAVAMITIYALVFILSRKLFRKSSDEASIQALTVAFSNNVAVGLPLLSVLYGGTGLLAVAAAIVAGVLVISPITLVLLECTASDAKGTRKPLVRRLGPAIVTSLRRPVILAPLCALAFPLTKHMLPAVANASLDLVGKATVGLALFLTGLILSAQPLKLSAEVWCGVLLKNVVQPGVVVCLLFIFRLHGEVAREAFLLGAVPAGFFGTVFGARYGVSSVEASSTLVLSTVVCIGTLPIAILLSGYLG